VHRLADRQCGLLEFFFLGRLTIVYRLVLGVACASPGPTHMNDAGPNSGVTIHL
jgi:hypothetical protein